MNYIGTELANTLLKNKSLNEIEKTINRLLQTELTEYLSYKETN